MPACIGANENARQSKYTGLSGQRCKKAHPAQGFYKAGKCTLSYNSRLDIDNHGYLSKLIIDGLKGYLLEDDRPKIHTGPAPMLLGGQRRAGGDF